MKNIFWIFILLTLLVHNSYSQQLPDKKQVFSADLLEKLEGLTKGFPAANQEITLDGERIPIYQLDGKRVKGMELMDLIMSGDYAPEFYMDDQNEIKICVLVKTANTKDKMHIQVDDGEDIIDEVVPFSAIDMQGNQISLDDLKGKVVVINFWFTACKPCIIEMPELNELVHKYKEKELVFLGITFDQKEQVAKFLQGRKFDYQVIPNAQKVISKYGVNSFPTHLVIDQKGEVAYSVTGLSSTTVKGIDYAIEELLRK